MITNLEVLDSIMTPAELAASKDSAKNGAEALPSTDTKKAIDALEAIDFRVHPCNMSDFGDK